MKKNSPSRPIDSSNKTLFSKTFVSAGLRLAGTGLGSVSAALVARQLGSTGYGIFSIAFVFASVLGIFVQFGIPNLVLRETSKGMDALDVTHIQSLWNWALRRVIRLSIAAVLIGSHLVLIYFQGWDSISATTALISLALVPIIALDELKSATLRGLGNVAAGQISSLLLRPLFFIAFLVTALLFSYDLDPISAMALRVIGSGCTLYIVIKLLNYYYPKVNTFPNTSTYTSENKKKWSSISMSMALTAGMGQITNYADILMLAIFTTSDEVGQYRVAYQVATLVPFGLKAVSMATAPSFARMSGNYQKLQLAVIFSSRLSITAAVVTSFVLVFFSDFILGDVFGPDFNAAHTVMMVLITGQIINAFFGPIGTLMSMVGFEKIAAKTMFHSAILNIVLNIFLIPMFGSMGAAISTLISFAFWNGAMWCILVSKTGVRSDPLVIKRSTKQK